MLRFLFTIAFLTTTLYATSANSSPLEDAKKDMSSGRYAQAITTLQSLVEKDQNNYEAWFLFGVAQVHEQKDHQAIEAFKHVIELRPELAEPHNNLAAVYNNLGDTKAAIKELETALNKRPNYSVAEENLADLYIKMALKHYRSSLNNGASAAVEQRYKRLLRVRNPAALPSESASTPTAKTDTPPEHAATGKANQPTTQDIAPVTKPAPSPTIAQNKPLNPAADESTTKQQMADTPSPAPSIAEDKSITGVLDALDTWRNAWSSQNLDTYFSAYADDYQPDARFSSLAAWQAYKTRVIQNKTFIDIKFDKVEVNIPASRDTATISLLQHFSSNSYTSDDHKVITMKYTPNGWKIVSEVSER